MKDIDEMDILGFLKVRAWEAKRKQALNPVPQRAYIDEVWSSLCPTGGE